MKMSARPWNLLLLFFVTVGSNVYAEEIIKAGVMAGVLEQESWTSIRDVIESQCPPLNLELQFLPATRLNKLSLDGGIDLDFARAGDYENSAGVADNLIKITPSIASTSVYLVSTADKFISNPSLLSEDDVVVSLRGNPSGLKFFKGKLHEVTKVEQGLDMLMLGRATAAIVISPTLNSWLKKNEKNASKIKWIKILDIEGYSYLNKKLKRLVPKFHDCYIKNHAKFQKIVDNASSPSM